MSERRLALEGLLTHPGWHLFKAEAKQRWGPVGYARELKKAVSDALNTNKSAEAAILAVERANDEVNSLFAWVDAELRGELAREERETGMVSVSRRGPGL